MPVVSYGPPRCQQWQAVQPFIKNCLERVAQEHTPQIASLNFAIPSLDPLVTLAHLHHRQQCHLYLERSVSGEAIAAFGHTLTYQSMGSGRFADAHRYIEQWLQRIHSFQSQDGLTDSGVPGPGARFFCTFSFFPQAAGDPIDFPAARVVLPQWQIWRQGSHCVLTLNVLLTLETTPQAVLDQLENRLRVLQNLTEHYPASYASPPPLPYHFSPRRPSGLAKHQFKAAVERALSHIEGRHIQKIVLAHALDWVREAAFQPYPSLAQLRQRYPDCFVFAVGNGKGKTFMGASPERLLSISQRWLVTDALAGSAPRGRNPQEDRQLALGLLHSPKEQGEHRLVVNFLAQRLGSLGLQPAYPTRPRLLRLSNIQHLHTPIRALLSGQTHPLQLVEALHPTPAVAGVPTRTACEQISTYEQFDRGLYAAPLGWIGANGDSEFIVGIRSALISDNWARLYAGAGIVAGSDPEREWAEINLKFRALSESLV